MTLSAVTRWQQAAFGAAGLLSLGVATGLVPPWTVALPCGTMAATLLALRLAIRHSERTLEEQKSEADVEKRHLTNVQEELQRVNGILKSRETELLEAVGHVEMSREAYRIASMRFEELFAGFPVPTFSYDSTGAIYEWNRAAEVLTGIEAKDAFGRDITDVFVNSPDFADFHREIVRVFKGDPVSGTNRRLNLGEAGTRHLICNSFPLRSVGRKISGGVTALLDVTGHVSAESKFRTLFEGGNDASLVLSRTGTILDANLQARLLLSGGTDESITGRAIGDFVSPAERREHSMFLRRAVRREIARGEWGYQSLFGDRIEADIAISGTTLDDEPVVLMQIHDLGERKRFESELKGAVAELERAQSIGQIGSWELDLQTGTFTWSQEMYRVCGWPEDAPVPNTRDFVRLAHPADQQALMDALRGAAAEDSSREVSHRLVRRDGVVRYAVSQISPLLAEDRIVGTVQDVTERKLEEMRILESESRFRAVVQSIDAGLMVVDSDLRVQMVNPSAERILGGAREGNFAFVSRDSLHVERDGTPIAFGDLPVNIALQKGTSVQSRVVGYKRTEEETVWLSVSAVPVRIPGLDTVRSAVVSFTDVTASLEYEKILQDEMELSRGLARDLADKISELSAANKKLKTLATTDGLTGLSNHRTFQEFLDAHTAQETGGVSLLMLDVDNFKGFNDAFGHRVGDEVLRDVARILQEHCRRGDMAARYGGEEFVLVLPHADSQQSREIAERLRAAVEAGPWTHRPVTISLGISTRTDGEHAHELIETADAALYSSKRNGRNCVTHREDLRSDRTQAA